VLPVFTIPAQREAARATLAAYADSQSPWSCPRQQASVHMVGSSVQPYELLLVAAPKGSVAGPAYSATADGTFSAAASSAHG